MLIREETKRDKNSIRVETRRAHLSLSLEERRRQLAEQAEKFISHYETTRNERKLWQGGDVFEF